MLGRLFGPQKGEQTESSEPWWHRPHRISPAHALSLLGDLLLKGQSILSKGGFLQMQLLFQAFPSSSLFLRKWWSVLPALGTPLRGSGFGDMATTQRNSDSRNVKSPCFHSYEMAISCFVSPKPSAPTLGLHNSASTPPSALHALEQLPPVQGWRWRWGWT